MSRKQMSDLDFGGLARIRNLPAPLNGDEPARLDDLNSAVQGLAWKDNVRVRAQVNVNLASPGTTIDGVTMASGDRFMAPVQTATTENGLYVWNGAATPATRSADMSTADEMENAVVTVDEGTSAGTSWRQTTVNFTLGAGSPAFSSFAPAVGAASETSAGTAELATQAETDAGIDDQRIVTPLKLSAWSARLKRAQGTIGDGSATQFDVSHNFATRDVSVQVFQATGNYELVNCDVSLPTTNTARLNFATPPAANSLRVVVMA